MKKLTVGSCFSGIGGLELGLEWTGGFETKWQIEMDAYASKVLEKHWPNVKRYSDIRDVVRPEPVDLICGGFPCQDVSLAGKRAGLEGQRSTLWREMFRLVCEVRPRWIVAENVRGLLSSDDGRFFGNILRDLAGIGYDAEWKMFLASKYGVPQNRWRVFIVAYPSRKNPNEVFFENPLYAQGHYEGLDAKSGRPSLSHDEDCRTCAMSILGNGEGAALSNGNGSGKNGRIPLRMDRYKTIGNAVVPQVAQKIGEMILDYELQTQEG